MLTNTKAKYIKSLQIKKYRKKHRSFLVEGAKNMLELLSAGYEIDCLVTTQDFYEKNRQLLNGGIEVYIEKEEKIKGLGTLKVNDAGLAVARIPGEQPLSIGHELVLVLDDVRDPGNLGTIVRTADWYGIKKIIASEESAEFYNPKVIQATMGSFTRVEVYYRDLSVFFEEFNTLDVLGAFLEGKAVYDIDYSLPAAVVMGNESKGISGSLEKYIGKKITIPRFGEAESLNVAMSTAIICDNLRRIELLHSK